MVKPSTLFNSTFGAAMLSTLLSTSAHAGLLGSGGLGGGLGAGLNGAFTPRSLNLDGQAAGQASRDGALLSRRDAVMGAVGDAAQNGKDEARSGTSKGAATKATATDSARNDAGVLRGQVGNASGQATGTAAAAVGAAQAPAPSTDSASPTMKTESAGVGTAATTRRADASAGASSQFSRADRSVTADTGAQGRVQR